MFVVQQHLKFLLKNVSFAVADPDHMIALGVGIFAGIKERKEDILDLILTDICPFSLGTGIINRDDPAKGNYMHTLIPRNSSLPASHSGCFSTVSDDQKMLPLHHPEEDPDGFMLLHEAYKTALDYAQENDGPANTSTRLFFRPLWYYEALPFYFRLFVASFLAPLLSLGSGDALLVLLIWFYILEFCIFYLKTYRKLGVFHHTMQKKGVITIKSRGDSSLFIGLTIYAMIGHLWLCLAVMELIMG